MESEIDASEVAKGILLLQFILPWFSLLCSYQSIFPLVSPYSYVDFLLWVFRKKKDEDNI